MSVMDEGKREPDLLRVRSDLEQASAGDDETRLTTLEDLYRSLEGELEGDADQASSSRR